jgi:acetyltransferase-like isoleucine patch superfamily enzyme
MLRGPDEMRLLLLRVARGPRTIVNLLVDRIIAPLWLRSLGVQVGAGCRFAGLPMVQLAPGARIVLGRNVVINSRRDSNPGGVSHPTVLAALEPHSSIVIGDDTGISAASVVARRGITIGRRVLIGIGACVWDSDFHPLDHEHRRLHATHDAACAPVRIDDEVFVGGRSLILKGVTIGAGAVVGAGSVVRADVGAGAIVAGNPARVVGMAAWSGIAATERRTLRGERVS